MGGLTWDRQALWSKARDAVPPPFLHLTSIVLQSSCGARPGEPESPISQLDTTVVASPWGFFPMELHFLFHVCSPQNRTGLGLQSSYFPPSKPGLSLFFHI